MWRREGGWRGSAVQSTKRTKKVEEKRCFMDTIRTIQKNWIGHIPRGDSLQRYNGGKRKALTKARGLDDGGRIRGTQEKAQHREVVESLDIWTCREEEDLEPTKLHFMKCHAPKDTLK